MSDTLEFSPDDVIAGRYRVLGLLGQGGMGTVWRVADQAEGGREVAIKTIRATGAVTPAQALAFREEYRAMTRLAHPNTIAVLDYGAIDDRTRYLAMELVPGRELTEVIDGRPLPLGEALALLTQLLQALDFIHSRLYIHRDIKAANVRVKPDGTLKLMDFGLMAQLGTPAKSGSVSGSPGYLPPESIRGGTLGAGADLYSVGCLAFELLTGRLPFEGKLREVVLAHAGTPAPALRMHRPDAPEALERIVAQLLEKDPTRRYQRAGEVLADLAELTEVARDGVAALSADQARSYLVAGALVGRDAELAELEAALGAVLEGRGTAMLVGAPAGTGKSRLVGELLVRARLADALVLSGRCSEGGGGPYEPLAAALRPLVGLTPSEETARFQPAFNLLFTRRAPVTGELAGAPAEAAHRAALDALAAWLAYHAERRPLVLAIDDLHWADSGTLEALRSLARRSAECRLLILGGLRDDEPGAAPWLRTAADGGFSRLALAPFSPAQVDALLTATLRDYAIAPDVLDRLVRTTGGNAFFVTEALRLLMDEGALIRDGVSWRFPAEADRLVIPATVEAAVLRRLAGLDPGALTVARAAAVTGARPCRVALHALVGGTEEALFAALDALVERQVLVREPDSYAFFHDRVREALYADLPAEERARLHRGYAEYLESEASAEQVSPAELAYHYGRAGVHESAWRFHRRAADLSLATGAVGCAVEHWRAAVPHAEAHDHPDREARLVGLWWEIGSRGTIVAAEAATEALEKLLPLLEGVCEGAFWGGALRKVVNLVRRLPAPWSDRVLIRLMTPAPYVHRPRTGWRKIVPPRLSAWMPRLVETYGYLGAAHGFAGRPARGLALADQALALFPFDGTPLEGSLRLVRCVNLLPAGRLDELFEEAARAVALLADDRYPCPEQTKKVTRVAAAGCRLAVAYQGRRPDAELEREAIRLAEAHGAFDIRNEATHWTAQWAAASGRRAVATAWIEEATRRCREADAPPSAHALYLDGLLRLQVGDADGALAVADRGMAAGHVPEGGVHYQSLAALRGQALLARGDQAGARAAFTAVLSIAEAGGIGQLVLMARLGLGEVALAAAEAEEARGPLEAARAAAAQGPLRNPLFEAIALRLLARADQANGDLDGAQRRLEAAMAIVGTSDLDNPLEQAHVLVAMGDLQARAGQPAAETLERALALYRELGATAFVASVEAAIAALPPVPAASGEPETPGRPNWMVTRAFGL